MGNLYGHPIAGRNWFQKFRKRMIYHGYTQSAHDPCLFYKTKDSGKGLFLLIVYVDDILTYVSKQSLYQEWFAWFDREFNWTNFDTNLHEFTSICITHTSDPLAVPAQAVRCRPRNRSLQHWRRDGGGETGCGLWQVAGAQAPHRVRESATATDLDLAPYAIEITSADPLARVR